MNDDLGDRGTSKAGHYFIPKHARDDCVPNSTAEGIQGSDETKTKLPIHPLTLHAVEDKDVYQARLLGSNGDVCTK